MTITYQSEPDLRVEDFISILRASTLAERRPVEDVERLGKMLKQADIIMTARDGARIVGVSRAITDFSYCCYLSDLAVAVEYQKQGIGKRLIDETHQMAGKRTSLILLSAPAAQSYYPKIGMTAIPNGWIILRSD